MKKTKGQASRLIKTPGYHIRSKYDLAGFRRLRTEGHQREYDVELPLTSMIDMFSMLVIFLLLNFSSTGEVFFINRGVTLPQTRHGRPLGDNPLITITADAVVFDAQVVGQNPLHIEESDQNLPQLRDALNQIKRQNNIIRPNQPFQGEVNIQADEGTPIIYVKRVMTTLISEGWTGIHFATTKIEDAQAAVE